MKTSKEALSTQEKRIDKIQKQEFFQEIMEIVKNNFIAIYNQEGDTTLLIRFINGQKFRLLIEEIT